MPDGVLTAPSPNVRPACAGFMDFLEGPLWARRLASRDACDFVFGNPHEMPLPAVVDAIRQAALPNHSGWFAYQQSDPVACRAVAVSLRDRLALPFAPDDIVLTKGASAALAIVLQTVLRPGDEAIYITPPWFFYEAMILAAGAVPVAVPCDRATFDLDVDAIHRALTPHTRAVIVNSPNNPTGRVYPERTLRELAQALGDASERYGEPIWLLSDEAYQRILFPETSFTSPTAYYPRSFLLYSCGKTLLTPGQRLGYIALTHPRCRTRTRSASRCSSPSSPAATVGPTHSCNTPFPSSSTSASTSNVCNAVETSSSQPSLIKATNFVPRRGRSTCW